MTDQAPPEMLYWYDEDPNFGDIIAPWMHTMATGRRSVNVRLRGGTSERPGIVTIGSLLHELDRPGHTVWGTGLICPIDEWIKAKLENAKPSRIEAVRGHLTSNELVNQLGWDIPQVFGDPALLLPRYYRPRIRPELRDKIAVIPHYIHLDRFREMAPDTSIVLVDARQHPSKVIDAIASVERVVSTSLHGVICAQAFGKPWVSLLLADSPLVGGSFKFEDFFSNLDRDQVAAYSARLDDLSSPVLIDLSKFATLPRTLADLDALDAAMPYGRSSTSSAAD
ncbi:MAG: polysaccharide pyruvyl transferase family protein [Devosia sp.]|uniref:polysaccharide pyruvyl transferase family protein n=1 Tax=Devosia sp. TaxID=1871048 RepID=UPI001A63B387|nr:polysaccharide pyruvyl transferase family protein [Devosia sp.]MBL8599244.1 polysaccharide pyruvyl transferase family protein [Devosia sp.]